MSQGGSTRVVIAALGANLLIAVSKFVAASLTQSSAMLAEACHSLADTANQLFLLLGLRLSRRPADRQHPFGYAPERYFWAFIVAVSIFTVGATFALYEGIQKIRHHADPEHVLRHPLWGLSVLGFGLAFEGVSFGIAFREFAKQKRGRSLAAMISDARDPVLLTVLVEDSAALFGLLTALVGLAASWATGSVIFDGIASVVVGLVLALVAFFLARETKDLLLGESVTADQAETIRKLVQAHPDVEQLVVQRTMHLGPDDVLAALKVVFRERLAGPAIAEAINAIEAELRATLPALKRIWIEPGTRAAPPAGEPLDAALPTRSSFPPRSSNIP